jgi:hypothetical protein
MPIGSRGSPTRDRTRKLVLRRVFLARSVAAGLGFAILARCGTSQAPSETATEPPTERYDPDLDCTDTSGLWPAELATRENNEYTDRSPHRDRHCFNCTNFIPPQTKGQCGRCDTVKGPINPLGWCKAWAEKR